MNVPFAVDSRRIFHPVSVLLIAVGAALIFAALIAFRFDGSMRRFLFYYFVPVSVPFTAFILDRLQSRPSYELLIDLPVVLLALTRAVYPLPIISGHVLFLTYALRTSTMVVTRLTASIVFLQVVYLKVFVWQDITLLGGIAAGLAAAWIYRRMRLQPSISTLLADHNVE